MFVIWAVDGWFPSARALDDDDELEEERRLMYVAHDARAESPGGRRIRSTSYSTRRGADYSIDQLSRFIDRGVRERRCSASSQRKPAARRVRHSRPSRRRHEPPIDLRALLRGRFAPERAWRLPSVIAYTCAATRGRSSRRHARRTDSSVGLRQLDDALDGPAQIAALARPHGVEQVEVGQVDAAREQRALSSRTRSSAPRADRRGAAAPSSSTRSPPRAAR